MLFKCHNKKIILPFVPLSQLTDEDDENNTLYYDMREKKFTGAGYFFKIVHGINK